jgi:hypothetical protein
MTAEESFSREFQTDYIHNYITTVKDIKYIS